MSKQLSTKISSMSLDMIKPMAEMAVKANLFPGIKTVESMTSLMMLCVAENIHPMHAVRRYHIISGQPSMKADAMLGEFQSRGGKVEWVCCTHDKVEAIFDAPGLSKPTPPVIWTIEDAQRASLLGNPTWKKYPRQMLRARVISEGIRMAMPEIIAGIYTPEEVSDFSPAPKKNEKIIQEQEDHFVQVVHEPEMTTLTDNFDIAEVTPVIEVTADMKKNVIEEILESNSEEDLNKVVSVIKDWPEAIKKEIRPEFSKRQKFIKENGDWL